MTGKRGTWTPGLLLASALVLASCASSGSRIYVNPDADMNFYKKIAVLPFTSLSPDQLAGPRVTRAFITELIMTNRYELVQPEEFRPVLEQLGGLPGSQGTMDPAKLREAAGKVGATGILRGAVTEYTMQRSGNSDSPVIAFDVELIDVGTGNVVWRASIAKRGKSRVPVFGGGGERTFGRLTQAACEELVDRLRREAL